MGLRMPIQGSAPLSLSPSLSARLPSPFPSSLRPHLAPPTFISDLKLVIIIRKRGRERRFLGDLPRPPALFEEFSPSLSFSLSFSPIGIMPPKRGPVPPSSPPLPTKGNLDPRPNSTLYNRSISYILFLPWPPYAPYLFEIQGRALFFMPT
ncbi:hypothetical protein IE53DRAFT_217422 [Violaceomyces palustris]|uniref:Uncharacterized protein n=1 Tax=Violaceomyces palustris TaxID=1673888 RepID=A0ACD0NQI0_9BASI|nr:hypothetical protein IE53DRAFT_217422 [Violaceomyces palustris]